MKRTLLVIGLYILLAIAVFGRLPQTFFQQDEWAILGNQIYADKAGISLFDRIFIYEQDTHLIPLSNLLTFLQYRLFRMDVAGYAWMAMILHVINTILVFAIARVLTRNARIATIAGGLFLINSISHQAITWLATTTGTVGGTTFFLFSLYLFIRYLQNERSSIWFLFGTIVSFAISLGFKETSIFGFLFFPAAWVLFDRKRSLKRGLLLASVLFVFGIAYILARYIFVSQQVAPSISPEALVQPSIAVYIFRTFALPIRVVAQSFLPQRVILELSRLVIALGYPQFMPGGTPDPYLVESAAADVISFFAAIGVVAVAVWILRFWRDRTIGISVWISFVFIALSALPFLAVPGRAGYNAILDGRHLYITGIFSSLLAATVFWGLLRYFSKQKIFVWILFGTVGIGIFYHIRTIRRDLDYQVAIGGLRRSMLKKIIETYPKFSNRVVFFVESDAPYYGLPFEEPIVPFQSGFGQTLLVWYNAHGNSLPGCFFEKKYLYVLLNEDFKECEGQGFGYYRKASTFNAAIKIHKFKPEEVIAFRFTSSTNQFTDVTNEIRNRLAQFGKL